MGADEGARDDIEAAIAALEAQRSTLGDTVVDLAVGPLRERLASLTPGASPGPALKQVTIMFIDMVGSTAAANVLDPEDVDELMDGILRRCSEIVTLHRGRVFNYTGDGFLSVFGADEAREDDAELAVRAGLAILAEARWLAEQVAERFGIDGVNVRVGIDTGPVLLGGSLEGERNIRGNAVNLAARMEQNAPVGGMRISHDTYRLVRGVFDVTEQPPISVKGIAQPVRTYLVHRAKPRSFRVTTRGIDGVETPMIGRHRELALLQQCFARLQDQRTWRAATVIADPGVGKSRLLHEFERWADEQPAPYEVFRGRAQPATRHQPFGLLRDLLAWWMAIADNDPADVARARYEQVMASLFADDETAGVHLLGHLIGLDYSTSAHVRGIAADPAQIRTRALTTLATMWRRRTAEVPALMLLEDLHWADDDTLDALQYLADTHRDLPVLILGSARPELLERRPGWLDGSAQHDRITLRPLEHGQVAELVDALLERVDDAPVRLRELLVGHGDGNPFFIEEMVKMLLDEGVLTTDAEGRWHVTAERLDLLQVPSTLMGVLQARLDALAAGDRVALQQASVIGYLFWDRALGALDERSPSSLGPLVGRGFVNHQPASSIAQAHEYTFQHHLLQQFTYDSVLKRDRQRYHFRAAAWLAELAAQRGPEFLAATAEHYERAGEAAMAIEYFVRAAEGAAARASKRLAVEHAERALALDPELPMRWRALVACESVAALGEDPTAHERVLDTLVECAEALGDDHARAHAALRQARALNDRADHALGEVHARRAATVAESSGHTGLAAEAYGEVARSARRTNRPSEALELASHGLTLAEACGDRRVEAQLLLSVAVAAGIVGDVVLEQDLLERALGLSVAAGDQLLEVSTLNSLGGALHGHGEMAAARELWERALRVSRGVEWVYGESLLSLNLAGLATNQGDNERAIELASAAVALAVRSRSRDLEAAASVRLGVAQYELGIAEARSTLEHARTLFLLNDGPHYALEPSAALAVLDLDEGDETRALARIDEIVEFTDAGGSLDGVDEPYRVRWECFDVLDRLGDPRAVRVLADAHALLQSAADALGDRVDRHRFLHASASQRAILAAWHEHVSSGASGSGRESDRDPRGDGL